MKNEQRGILYVVGTPIGNLKDITLRAIETLQNADIILAEDTRQTLKLLNHLNIEKHMISYHRHNEENKVQMVVSLLDEGKNIALVSDAGMPIISDPGQGLVKYLVENESIALSREKILNNVWNCDYYGDSRTIDSHIKKIRHKLGKRGKYIKTMRGIGYKFEVK